MRRPSSFQRHSQPRGTLCALLQVSLGRLEPSLLARPELLRHVRCRLGGMKHHEHYTELEQGELDWISRFSDRLRLMRPHFAEEDASLQASEIAATAWER